MQCAVAGAFHTTFLLAEELGDCSTALGNERIHRFAHGRLSDRNPHASAAHLDHTIPCSQPRLVFCCHGRHCLLHCSQQFILAHLANICRLHAQLFSQSLRHNMVAQLVQDDRQPCITLQAGIYGELTSGVVKHSATETRCRISFSQCSYCWQIQRSCQLVDQSKLLGDLCTWFSGSFWCGRLSTR